MNYFKQYTGKENESIRRAMEEIGANGDFYYRATVAKANNFVNYSGTAEQNLKMLAMLKAGTLIMPEGDEQKYPDAIATNQQQQHLQQPAKAKKILKWGLIGGGMLAAVLLIVKLAKGNSNQLNGVDEQPDRRWKSIINAIKSGRLNCDRHCNDEPFSWYGRRLRIKPLFSSYGQIGYEIYDCDNRRSLSWDYEMRTFEEN